MLVLNRKEKEVIMIGDSIRITIVRIKHGDVGVGIDAPRDLPVHRQEVYETIQRETEAKLRNEGLLPIEDASPKPLALEAPLKNRRKKGGDQ